MKLKYISKALVHLGMVYRLNSVVTGTFRPCLEVPTQFNLSRLLNP